MPRFLLLIFMFLWGLTRTFAHHPSGGVVLGGATNSQNNNLGFPLPIAVGLDGDLVFGYHTSLQGPISWTLSPVPVIGYDQYSFVLRRGEASRAFRGPAPDAEISVTAMKKWSLGLGLGIGTATPLGPSPFVGLIPSYGQQVMVKRLGKVKAELLAFEKSLPMTLPELETWREGEQLIYHKTAKLGGSIGLTYFFVGPSWSSFLEQDTKVEWKKLKGKKVSVAITRSRQKGTGVALGSDLGGIGASITSVSDKTVIIEFDLVGEHALAAYVKLMKEGNLKASEELIYHESEGVQAQLRSRARTQERSRYARAQLPFLIGVSTVKSQAFQLGFSEELSHTDKRHIYSSVRSLQGMSWGFLSNRKRRAKVAAANITYQEHTHSNGSSEKHIRAGGNINFTYRRKKVSRRRFEKEVAKIYKRTGARSLKGLLPIQKKLGDVEIKFDTTISKKGVEYFVDLVKQKHLEEKNFKLEALAIFQKELGRDNPCLERMRGKSCLRKTRKRFIRCLDEVWKYMKQMSEAYQVKDKKFTRAFSRLLEQSVKDRFCFQGLWQQLPAKYINHQLEIKGENFLPLVR